MHTGRRWALTPATDACSGGVLFFCSVPRVSCERDPGPGPGSAPAGLCLALALVDRLLLQGGSLLITGVWSRRRGCSPSIIHPSSQVTSHKHSGLGSSVPSARSYRFCGSAGQPSPDRLKAPSSERRRSSDVQWELWVSSRLQLLHPQVASSRRRASCSLACTWNVRNRVSMLKVHIPAASAAALQAEGPELAVLGQACVSGDADGLTRARPCRKNLSSRPEKRRGLSLGH